MKGLRRNKGQTLDCALLGRGRAPVPSQLCVALGSAPTGSSHALVLSSASLNLQLQLDALILGVVSHELRTPLGVISMAANLLLSDEISAAQRRTVQRITTASRHCDRLVSDLLDFTAARGSGITLLRGPRDLHTIAAQALDSAGHRRGSVELGLFIVRHLVVAHDGAIDVSSNGSDGTRLPQSAADSSAG